VVTQIYKTGSNLGHWDNLLLTREYLWNTPSTYNSLSATRCREIVQCDRKLQCLCKLWHNYFRSSALLQLLTVVVPGGVSVAPQRPVSKSPTVLPIAPQTSLSSRSSAVSVASSKGTAAVAPQPICLSKPQQQQQLAQNSTSVLSQLGMTLSALYYVQ